MLELLNFTLEEKQQLGLNKKKFGSFASFLLDLLEQEEDQAFINFFKETKFTEAWKEKIKSKQWEVFSLDGLDGFEWEISYLKSHPQTLLIRTLGTHQFLSLFYLSNVDESAKPIFSSSQDIIIIPDIRKLETLSFFLTSSDAILLQYQEEEDKELLYAVPILDEEFNAEVSEEKIEIDPLWSELLEDDEWLRKELELHFETGLLWSIALGIGLIARLIRLSTARKKAWLQSRLQGKIHSIDHLWTWASSLSKEQYQELLNMCRMRLDELHEEMLNLEETTDSENDDWRANFKFFLWQRDNLETILWILDKSSLDTSSLLEETKMFDEEAELFIRSQPYIEELREDERLQRVAALQPESWWVYEIVHERETLEEIAASVKESFVTRILKVISTTLDGLRSDFEIVLPAIQENALFPSAADSISEDDDDFKNYSISAIEKDIFDLMAEPSVDPLQYQFVILPDDPVVGKQGKVSLFDKVFWEGEIYEKIPLILESNSSKNEKIDVHFLANHIKIEVKLDE